MLDAPAILVVEDRAIVAAKVKCDLERAGFVVAAVIATEPEAVVAAQTLPIRGAVLDVDLRGEKVFPVAAILRARRLPFLFLTGYGRAALPREWQATPLLEKPFVGNALAVALRQALGGVHPDPLTPRVATAAIRGAWDQRRLARDLVTEQRAWSEQNRPTRG